MDMATQPWALDGTESALKFEIAIRFSLRLGEED